MSSNSERQPPSEWYFITPPQDVTWTKNGQYSQIDTYGTNQPYLQYGMTGLRELNLGNAMIEGFSNAKKVEGNVRDLEACMLMQLNEGGGFTSPYCWMVFAGTKMYGTFLITSVNIRETMRDAGGQATRAFADITLHEVSDYQVESGIDLASRATYSTKPIPKKQEEKAQDAKGQMSPSQYAELLQKANELMDANEGLSAAQALDRADDILYGGDKATRQRFQQRAAEDRLKAQRALEKKRAGAAK